MPRCEVYEVFFGDKNERMAMVYDYAQQKQVVIKDSNIRIPNALNMDIGDYIEFESRYHGWVDGRIIRITSSPLCRDEYKIEYSIDGDDTVYYDEVEDQFL